MEGSLYNSNALKSKAHLQASNEKKLQEERGSTERKMHLMSCIEINCTLPSISNI